ncbi:MAG: CvpA family protein [Pirellulales bacterium]|nr:CvpA family protein [Pirellulales bacterium]
MQPYDILMLVVLFGMTLFGVWKGMAWQAAALASVILSAVVAVNFSPSLAPLISAEEPWNRILAMLILYIFTAVVIWLLFRLVSNVIDRVKLKEFDRQLGAMFGLAKGCLYCVIITFFAVTLSEPVRQKVLDSKSGELIARGIRRANPIIPDDIRSWLGKYIDELDEKLHAPPKQASEESETALPLENGEGKETTGEGDAQPITPPPQASPPTS